MIYYNLNNIKNNNQKMKADNQQKTALKLINK